MKKIKSGQWVEHKYRRPREYAKVSYIKDSKVFVDGISASFWFLDNIQHSKKLYHRILNFFVR